MKLRKVSLWGMAVSMGIIRLELDGLVVVRDRTAPEALFFW